MKKYEGLKKEFEEEIKKIRKKNCPLCGKKDMVIPIFYGYTSIVAMELWKKGKIKLGGCIICNNAPEFHCKRCKYDF